MGGKGQVSDIGIKNLSKTIVSDKTKKKGIRGRVDRGYIALNKDWNQFLCDNIVPKSTTVGGKGGKGKGKGSVKRIWRIF